MVSSIALTNGQCCLALCVGQQQLITKPKTKQTLTYIHTFTIVDTLQDRQVSAE